MQHTTGPHLVTSATNVIDASHRFAGRPTRAVEAELATIMVCDLTQSMSVFEKLPTPDAVDIINEYLSMVCEVALLFGGTVDKYTGDGALLRFNVPHPCTDHPRAAVTAARAMLLRFEAIKNHWIARHPDLANTYHRAGIAYGAVHHSSIGHPSNSYHTVFGQAVGTAAKLCEVAPRSRNTIVLDRRLRAVLGGSVATRKMPIEAGSAYHECAENAFELVGGE